MINGDKKRLSFIYIQENLILYNNITGLFYYVNESVKEDILNSAKTGNINEEIEHFLYKMHFNGEFEKFYLSIYPKISPYAVWDSKKIYSFIGKEYIEIDINDTEFKIFELSDGLRTIEEICVILKLTKYNIFEVLGKFVNKDLQLVKLFNEPWV